MTSEGFQDSKDQFMDRLTEAFSGDSVKGTVRLSFKRGSLNRQLPGTVKVHETKRQAKGTERRQYGTGK